MQTLHHNSRTAVYSQSVSVLQMDLCFVAGAGSHFGVEADTLNFGTRYTIASDNVYLKSGIPIVLTSTTRIITNFVE